jgi:hypothetical protein
MFQTGYWGKGMTGTSAPLKIVSTHRDDTPSGKAGCVDQFVAEKASITSLAERAKHLIETIHRDVSQGWEHADVFLGGVRFNIPLLRLDQRRFGMIRHALFPEATRSVAGDKIEEILPRIHLIIKMLEDLSTRSSER